MKRRADMWNMLRDMRNAHSGGHTAIALCRHPRQPILGCDLGDSVVIRPDRCEWGNPLPVVRVQGRVTDPLTLTAGERLAVATPAERVRGVELFQVRPRRPV